MDPINGKNFRKINNVTNYTKPNSFPFKETIGRNGIQYRSYGTIYGSKTVRSQESGEVFASSLPNCGKKESCSEDGSTEKGKFINIVTCAKR